MSRVTELAAGRGGDKAPRPVDLTLPDPEDPQNPIGIIGGAVALVYRDPASGELYEHQFVGDGDVRQGAPAVAVQDGCVYLASDSIHLTAHGLEDGDEDEDGDEGGDEDDDEDDGNGDEDAANEEGVEPSDGV